MTRQLPILLCILVLNVDVAGLVYGQDVQQGPAPTTAPLVSGEDEVSAAPAKVDITPLAKDDEIRDRLKRVLVATDWFTDPDVQVEEGVVFLSGEASTGDLKKWAGDLARNTQDVVAVANRMTVAQLPIWDLSPAWTGLHTLWRDVIRAIPFLLFGLLVLAFSLFAGIVTTRVSRTKLANNVQGKLLRNVIARSLGVFVFLFGAYIILRVSGLTQLALSVVGGTGLVGLAVGIAFRDITENFLASIFLSLQRPFETTDLVEVAGVTGFVQQLNIRTTILMTLDGNIVQIPNATVYKSNLRNFSTNPNRREDFIVGVGYDTPINKAQEIARQVLIDHPAILQDPEPSVLADSMGTATINLRVYFWLNGDEHSWLKVRSAVIRLVKIAFQENGVSMPDEAREIVFPNGIPVTMVHEPSDHQPVESTPIAVTEAGETASTDAEAGLYSEADVIKDQARQVIPLQQEENLLDKKKKPQ